MTLSAEYQCFTGFMDLFPAVNRNILSLTRQAGFDELESEDIEDILAYQTEELTNEDLRQLTEHSPVEDNDDEKEPLTSKRMAESFNMIQQAKQILIDDDPNREHCSKTVLSPDGVPID
ncbi:putative Tigger transposable element-derived protein 1-like 258 [Homarus americanus]|uniref:Putative Tigger transposable element-derived protein 1-like 258 n=1 Tax=Homarus americanus TaxID=6706 RepID=A0A8J5MYR3_HOMAM|nr:putative Tigger transposable element-derived protein 1-like 258 [Homarus americanus]